MDAFQAIADPTRRKLIELLGDGERPVGSLVEEFDMSFAAISQHLKILSESKLVASRRDGRRQVYRLQSAELDPVAEWLSQYATAFWRRKLDRLGTVVDRLQSEGDEL